MLTTFFSGSLIRREPSIPAAQIIILAIRLFAQMIHISYLYHTAKVGGSFVKLFSLF